ncbi:MAG: hypothetical protein AAF961_10765, partial [Planctomycetota bacterium]
MPIDGIGASIWQATAGLFESVDWGRCTKRLEDRRTMRYLNVFSRMDGKRRTADTGTQERNRLGHILGSRRCDQVALEQELRLA